MEEYTQSYRSDFGPDRPSKRDPKVVFSFGSGFGTRSGSPDAVNSC